MYKVLDEQVNIKIEGQWHTLKAILTTTMGGKRVEYLDEIGRVVHSQPLSRSQYAKNVNNMDNK
jgi:hypothetical protein